MTPIDEPDPDADLARRRREVAKRLHPDRGGDPAAFVAAMAALDAAGPPPRPGDHAGDDRSHDVSGFRGYPPPRGGAAVRTTLRGRIRRLRRKAVRRVSRRRYIDVSPPDPGGPRRPPPSSQES